MISPRRHLEPAEFARTRALPAAVAGEIGEAFALLLPPRARVIDLGAGTGRLAHLLLGRGFDVTALDISRQMLSYLRDHRPPSAARLRVAAGDVARLPFADGAFDAAISAHVLHLVEHWQTALSEGLRVLRPGGLFIRAWSDHEPSDPLEEISSHWRGILAAHGFHPRPGVTDDEPIAVWMRGRGWSDRRLTAATWSRDRTAREVLDGIRHRHYPFSCDVPDDGFAELYAELEAWAARRKFDLDRAQPRTTSFVMNIFSFSENPNAP